MKIFHHVTPLNVNHDDVTVQNTPEGITAHQSLLTNSRWMEGRDSFTSLEQKSGRENEIRGRHVMTSGVTMGGTGGTCPPYWSSAPSGAPHMEIVMLTKTYNKLLPGAPQNRMPLWWQTPAHRLRMPCYATGSDYWLNQLQPPYE